MAYTENIDKQKPSRGWDMVTNLRESRAHPSLADGCHVTGTSDGGTATGSPGGVLGTGSNPDLYTPGIEAV